MCIVFKYLKKIADLNYRKIVQNLLLSSVNFLQKQLNCSCLSKFRHYFPQFLMLPATTLSGKEFKFQLFFS